MSALKTASYGILTAIFLFVQNPVFQTTAETILYSIQYNTLSIHRLSFFIINVQYYLGKPCLSPRIPCENTVWLHPAGIEPRTIPCSPCLCIPTVWIIVEIFFFPGFQFSMYIVPTIHRIRSLSETSSDYTPDPVPIGNQF